MTFSTYAANKAGDHVRGRTSFTMPTTYLALYTASPGVGGSATTNEATYTSYARVACGTGAGSIFAAASAGATNNPSTVSFPTNTGPSQTITHVGIVDSASGAGNLLEFVALTVARTFNNGDTPSFSAAALTDTYT